MVETFTMNGDPRVKSSLDLLRHMFIGYFGFVKIVDSEEQKLAEFLTAEGVLLKDKVDNDQFKMSSFFIDEVIRRRVIPEVYKSCPTVATPKNDDDSLDVLNTLRIAIQYFDRSIIYNAFNRSFKTARGVYVNGQKNKVVPRESVYDCELNRVLVNWIVKLNSYEVTGQWHLVEHRDDEKDKHYYSDIVINAQHKKKVVLELLATATSKELDKHFVRVLDYARLLSANDIWIVNFTCEDHATEIPYWPSDKKFEKINIVHFFHDQTFENVRMSARSVSTSGTFDFIEDQQVIPDAIS